MTLKISALPAHGVLRVQMRGAFRDSDLLCSEHLGTYMERHRAIGPSDNPSVALPLTCCCLPPAYNILCFWFASLFLISAVLILEGLWVEWAGLELEDVGKLHHEKLRGQAADAAV